MYLVIQFDYTVKVIEMLNDPSHLMRSELKKKNASC